MPGEILEKIESGPQLTASELTRLQRAALLIALLFIVAAACFGTIAQSAPNPLLAGIGSFFAWCGIVGAIHYFFFRSAVRDQRNFELRLPFPSPFLPCSMVRQDQRRLRVAEGIDRVPSMEIDRT